MEKPFSNFLDQLLSSPLLSTSGPVGTSLFFRPSPGLQPAPLPRLARPAQTRPKQPPSAQLLCAPLALNPSALPTPGKAAAAARWQEHERPRPPSSVPRAPVMSAACPVPDTDIEDGRPSPNPSPRVPYKTGVALPRSPRRHHPRHLAQPRSPRRRARTLSWPCRASSPRTRRRAGAPRPRRAPEPPEPSRRRRSASALLPSRHHHSVKPRPSATSSTRSCSRPRAPPRRTLPLQ